MRQVASARREATERARMNLAAAAAAGVETLRLGSGGGGDGSGEAAAAGSIDPLVRWSTHHSVFFPLALLG